MHKTREILSLQTESILPPFQDSAMNAECEINDHFINSLVLETMT